MSGIKSLAKDTAIYGLSSIIGRFLNWMLVPLYTIMFPVEEYGVVTYVYSVVAMAMVILVYGLETGFFRFANHERWSNPQEVYSTCLVSLLISSSAFVALVAVFLPEITIWMECSGHPSYVMMMAICVAIDAFLSLPYSYLRYQKRPLRFATIRCLNIGVNISLNLFFILLCPKLMEIAPWMVDWFYQPDFGIGYIFLSNLIASALNLILMLPEITGFKYKFNSRLWREIISYSLPLLVLGIAGIMNQTIDKIIYPKLITNEAEAMFGLGIYGANYKIAVIMLVFLQAFRFAYEPFIFARAKETNGKGKEQTYSDAMKYFVIFTLFIFLGVMFYLDIIKYFISPKYFSGLKVVPIVMLAELFFGIFFNLSLWYKLTDKTIYGMWFSLLGLAITVILNIILVPHLKYMGCAIAALCSYGTMMITSYFIGRKHYPIPYHISRLLSYFALAAVLYTVGVVALQATNISDWILAIIRAGLLAIYIAIVMRVEHLTFAKIFSPIISMLRKR